MKTLTFDLKGCLGTTPAPIEVPEIQCVAVDEIKSSEAKPGGRTVLVTPYGDSGICSGQYGQWQVLTGFGGQINRGMYCGDSFEKEEGYSSPGVKSTVDCDDTVEKGTKCLAIRDRGRWFVFCPKGGGGGVSGGANTVVGSVLGGNVFPSVLHDTVTLTDPVLRATYPVPDITVDEYGYLDSEYPSLRPYSYSLPDTDAADNRLADPLVNDWRKYDLPSDFEIGDKLPRLPYGLCYVRVSRPYKLGTKSWDGDDIDAPRRPASGDQLPVKAVNQETSVLVWYRHAADQGLPTGEAPGSVWQLGVGFSQPSTSQEGVRARFTVLNAGSAWVLGDWTVGVGNTSFAPDGSVTLILYKFKNSFAPVPLGSGDLTGTEAVTVKVPSGLVVSSGSDTAAAGATLPALRGLVIDTIAICLNDSSTQGFRAGDLVYIQDTPIQLQDRYGMVSPLGNQQRTVYRILGGISGVKSNIPRN